MNLRNGKITLGEILRNPKARQLVEREAPGVLGSPLVRRFQGMTLEQAMGLLRRHIPAARMEALLRELEAL